MTTSSPKSDTRTPLPVFVLCVLLTVWNPLSLAFVAAASVDGFSRRSALFLFFLATRLFVTSIGIAVGLALWLRHPGAVDLAKLSLMLFGAEAAVRLSTNANLVSLMPGTELPRALLVIAHYSAWYVYFQKSGRVRTVYGLESQPPRT